MNLLSEGLLVSTKYIEFMDPWIFDIRFMSAILFIQKFKQLILNKLQISYLAYIKGSLEFYLDN